MNLETYQRLNAGFKLHCVYHLGVRPGFIAEYNNMVWAMLYCLRCGMAFSLATRDAAFAFKKGWQDYFLPFCPERQSWLHHRWLHPVQPAETHRYAIQDGLLGDIVRQLEKADALTHDIWNGMRRQDTGLVEIPDLGIRAPFREISAGLVDATWRFNPETQGLINAYHATLHLPERYIGVHIPDGTPRNVSEHINKVRAVSGLRDVFIMSADLKTIALLYDLHPDFNFYSLAPAPVKGLRQRYIVRRGKWSVRRRHLELFASIEILRRAEAVVCDFSTDLGVFLGMAMPFDRCHGIEGEWKTNLLGC